MLGSESASGLASIGFSPHIVEEVAREGAAHPYLMPGDEIAALDGKVVVTLDYKAVRQLLAQAAELKSSITVSVIRRQPGDNWGLTSRTLDFEIPLTTKGPRPTHINEQVQHTPSVSAVSQVTAALGANPSPASHNADASARRPVTRPVHTPIALQVEREVGRHESGDQRQSEPAGAATEFWSSVAAPFGSVIGQGFIGGGKAQAVPPPRNASRPEIRADGAAPAVAAIPKVYVPAIFRAGSEAATEVRSAGQGHEPAPPGHHQGSGGTASSGARERARGASPGGATQDASSGDDSAMHAKVPPWIGIQGASAAGGGATAAPKTALAAYLLRMPASGSAGNGGEGSAGGGAGRGGEQQLSEVATWRAQEASGAAGGNGRGATGGDGAEGPGGLQHGSVAESEQRVSATRSGRGAEEGREEGGGAQRGVSDKAPVLGPRTPTRKPAAGGADGRARPRAGLSMDPGWGAMGGWANAPGLQLQVSPSLPHVMLTLPAPRADRWAALPHLCLPI